MMTSNFVFDFIAGTSEPTRRLRRRALQLANYNFNILVSGPNGSGKRLIAEAIHRHGTRNARPFIPVNCATLSGPFFNSQMLGQSSRGLLARSTTLGCIRSADGGTLFLQNVDRLSVEEQATLVDVLKSKSVVTNDTVHAIDVRVIASSSVNLEDEVRDGRFLAELYGLLSTTEVDCPALAERSEDIRSLASFFLAKSTLERGLGQIRLAVARRALFEAYDWPGNVRELEIAIDEAVDSNEFEQTLGLSDFDEIADRLAEQTTAEEAAQIESRRSLKSADAGQIDSQHVNAIESVTQIRPTGQWPTLAQAEARHILQTLEEANFNHSVAAKMLQVSKASLDEKLERYRLRYYVQTEDRIDERDTV